MKKSTLIWIGVYALVGYTAYAMFFSKKSFAKKIIDTGASTGTVESLMNFEMGFLRAWAKSASGKENSFTYNGKSFYTKGGRAVK